MSEQTTSQVQQLSEAFRRLLDDQVARLQAMSAEATKLENKVLEGAHAALDESARLVKGSLEYAAQLNGEYRKLTLEATRRLAGWVAPRS